MKYPSGTYVCDARAEVRYYKDKPFRFMIYYWSLSTTHSRCFGNIPNLVTGLNTISVDLQLYMNMKFTRIGTIEATFRRLFSAKLSYLLLN